MREKENRTRESSPSDYRLPYLPHLKLVPRIILVSAISPFVFSLELSFFGGIVSFFLASSYIFFVFFPTPRLSYSSVSDDYCRSCLIFFSVYDLMNLCHDSVHLLRELYAIHGDFKKP